MAKRETVILWKGPSLINGESIVVLAQSTSTNDKTGNMVQTYILLENVNPLEASRTGQDEAICGNCIHRGKPSNRDSGVAIDRTCYVTLAHAPLGVWKKYKAGGYGNHVCSRQEIVAFGAYRGVRIGTYGDPCAVPSHIWTSLISRADFQTAYTHGEVNPLPQYIMTSADSLQDAEKAWEKGERSFRVVSSLRDIVKGKEILCPASEEAGKRVQCADCKPCGGASVKGKSIAIPAHGTSKRKAKELVAAQESV